MFTQKPRLLVKTKPLAAGLAFQVGKIPFKLEPLTPPSPHAAVLGAAAPAQWHLTDAPDGLDEVHIWDLCHSLHANGMGMAGAHAVEAAEPDLQQQWIYDRPDRVAAKAFQATASPDVCKQPDGPDSRYPSPANFDWRWFQDPNHSGLDAARSQIQNPKNRVSIAHLDTGYRKGHSVLPQFLDTGAQRSFVEGDPDPNDASDPDNEGFGKNPGHGTGTISILAGSLFNGDPFKDPSGLVGGAPFARVVPVRVANSVVLFTTSSVARGIDYATRNNLDVLSMSMGGVPSQAWADMVNAAYEAGLTLVTAAGNNFGPFKLRVPRFIVYPARFGRVIAACGVMSDGKPYADFADPRKMGGLYGPDSKMDTAMAAYTPNTAWAKYACTNIVDFDGAGTSAATPQVAAAAACWLQKNLDAVHKLPQPWMRVEAVRQALFSSADPKNREHFGRGTLRANKAMDQVLADPSILKKQAIDSVGVPILGPVLGEIFGAAAVSSRQSMLHIEAAQVLTRSAELQQILADANQDPDRPQHDVPRDVMNHFVQAMAEDPNTSKTLKEALGGAPVSKTRPAVFAGPVSAESPVFPEPVTRKLRVFAFDPALGMRVDTESLTETTLEVPWEQDLQLGPVGEYIEVVDVDPASDSCYAPVDLNHPHILAANGLDPAEGVPQFHQQMVYAIAMTTISRFEDALGRKALWAPRIVKAHDGLHSQYVQRLRIYPHALREENAYYSPPKKSLLFGYFQANTQNAGDNLPGGLVFSCLSHDIVAHETTHALLDGLHRYYQEQTNPDIAAFHEAFAGIVAISRSFEKSAREDSRRSTLR